MDVLKRTLDNGGLREETSVVTPEGEVFRGKTGDYSEGGITKSKLPAVVGENNTSIHSHRTAVTVTGGDNALEPGPEDPPAFKGFRRNSLSYKFNLPLNKKGVKMISMVDKQKIIHYWHIEKKSEVEISKELRLSRNTVRRYLNMFRHALERSRMSGKPQPVFGEFLLSIPRYNSLNRGKRKLHTEIIQAIKGYLPENEKIRNFNRFRK